MADEITVEATLNIDNGNLQRLDPDPPQLITQSVAKGPVPGMVTVTTTASAISLTGLTTYGLVKVKNLSSSNYVTYGVYVSSVFYPLIRIKPDEHYVWRMEPGVTPYMQANVASCDVQIEAYND